jgi:hypothetical protein
VAKNQLPARLYRIHQAVHEPEWFGNSGDFRWDPPPDALEAFGTCYTATDPVTALLEVIADLPVITESLLADRALAELELPADPQLADMTSPKILGWGLDKRISVGDDYPVCQRWAQALRMAGFTGTYYEPRHELRTPPGHAVAFFGDRGYQPTQIRAVDDGPISPFLIESARVGFELRILPTMRLLPPTGDF